MLQVTRNLIKLESQDNKCLIPNLDCACIAAVAALAHFRRPDCTTSGNGEFIIHKSSEKDLIPIVLHHYPICVNYALFEGKTPIADPTLIEERVTNASLILAINAYKELCSIHLTGVSLTSPFLIQKCSEMAADRAKHVVEFIKATLLADLSDRETGNVKGFSQSIKLTNIPSNFCDVQQIDQVMDETNSNEGHDSEEMVPEKSFEKPDNDTVATNWVNESSSESVSEDEEMPSVQKKTTVKKNQKKPQKEVEMIDSSDEERETIVLN